MPYLISASVEQVGRGPGSATVRVHWGFGNLMPDLVEVRRPGDTVTEPVLLASVPIDNTARTPTSVDLAVPAPNVLSLAVSPRTADNGTLNDRMADDAGTDQYWESFSLQTTPLGVGPEPEPTPSSQAPPVPENLRVETGWGRFTVHWESPGARHFNVRDVPSAQDQIELPGSARAYTEERVAAGRYRFSIQACNTGWSLTNRSVCSGWASTEIVMPPELGFTTWRPWFMIHPERVFNQVTPVATVARRQDHVDLFKVGFDGAVWSSWWDQDQHGWRPWFQIHPQTIFAQEAPVVAHARRPDHVDLFITGLDGAIWSTWWHDDGGSWRPWFPVHPQTVFRQDRPVAVVSRMSEHIDLFRVGFDGAVWSSWWHGEGDPGGWRPWFQIHAETRFPADARVTTLSRRADHVDLFVVGHDGAVWSSWWHADAEGWRPWFPIHPQTVFRHDQEIVAVSREPEHLDLFTIGHDGAVWSSWWHGDGGGWRPWFQIHPVTRFAPTSRITAIARRSDHVDLFVTGLDGAVWSSWWHADAEGWRPWFPIHPNTVFDQGHPVAAVARQSDHLDLFKVGLNGAVWSAWWSPT